MYRRRGTEKVKIFNDAAHIISAVARECGDKLEHKFEMKGGALSQVILSKYLYFKDAVGRVSLGRQGLLCLQ